MSEPFVSGDTIATVAWHLSPKDYQQRVDWISSLPEGSGRGDALSRQVRDWADSDANAAGEWLGGQQGSPDYDRAAGSFADKIVGKDPVSALAWAGTIQESGLRRRVEERLLRNWQKREPDAAADWVRQNRS